MLAEEWARFSTALSLTLSRLPDDGYLILHTGGNGGAQFVVLRDHLWFDILSDSDGNSAHRLRTEDSTTLTSQGWTPPSETYPNWHMTIGWPAPPKVFDAVTEKTVTALRENLRLQSPSQLRAEAGIRNSPAVPDITALELEPQRPAWALATPPTASPVDQHRTTWTPVEARPDIAGALTIMRSAAIFDWNWTTNDLRRFGSSLGWHMPDHGGPLDTITTNVAVSDAVSYIDISGDALQSISIAVTDTAPDPDLPAVRHADVAKALLDGFAALSGPMVTELGRPNRNSTGSDVEIGWDLTNVVILLEVSTQTVFLTLTNPVHQKLMDGPEDL